MASIDEASQHCQQSPGVLPCHQPLAIVLIQKLLVVMPDDVGQGEVGGLCGVQRGVHEVQNLVECWGEHKAHGKVTLQYQQ